MVRVGLLVVMAGVALVASSSAAATQPITVGVTAQVTPEADRSALLTALKGLLAGPNLRIVEGCDDVMFCVTVVGAPVRIGRRDGGRSLASYVTRRLLVHPNWPWQLAPKPAGEPGAAPVTIVDAYTAGGDVACVPCERDLEKLQLEVDTVKAVTDATMVDEGDLRLHVGPATSAFMAEVAADIASGLIERHVEPWRESRKGR